MKNISYITKEDCNGCSACSNICAQDAIEMKPDHEGFLYPEIDLNRCNDCGICLLRCPSYNLVEKINYQLMYMLFGVKMNIHVGPLLPEERFLF